MRKAVIAGSFDPITLGHLDIILRSLHLCDQLIIGVGVNSAKKTLFTSAERIKLIGETMFESCSPEFDENWKAMTYEGLLVDFAKEMGANVLIRGVRSVTDFEYETNFNYINSQLSPDIETVLLITKPELSSVSSSAVKELALYNAPLHNMVSKCVEEAVRKKLSNT